MSERIRYRKVADGTLESVREFRHTSNGALYVLSLTPASLSYAVLDATTRAAAASGTAVSLHRLKILARDALAALGVELSREERKKRSE